jgi:hypothetical protein
LREMQRHPVCLGKKSRKHQTFCKWIVEMWLKRRQRFQVWTTTIISFDWTDVSSRHRPSRLLHKIVHTYICMCGTCTGLEIRIIR